MGCSDSKRTLQTALQPKIGPSTHSHTTQSANRNPSSQQSLPSHHWEAVVIEDVLSEEEQSAPLEEKNSEYFSHPRSNQLQGVNPDMLLIEEWYFRMKPPVVSAEGKLDMYFNQVMSKSSGGNLLRKGASREVMDNFLRHLGVYERGKGKQSMECALLLKKLGSNKLVQGKQGQALDFYCRSQRIYERCGSEDGGYADMLEWMAYLMDGKGQTDKAIVYYEKSSSLNARVRGENAEETIRTLNNLATLLDTKHRRCQALKIYEQTIGYIPLHYTGHFKMAVILYHQQEYQKAVEHFQKCLLLAQKHYKEYKNMLAVLINISRTYLQLHQLESFHKALTKIKEIQVFQLAYQAQIKALRTIKLSEGK